MKETSNAQPSIATSLLDELKAQKVFKFFVVDDDEYFNKLVSTYIQKIAKENNFHAEVSSFANGGNCMEHITENPDFVILDFYLDENNDITLTGYDVLEKIESYNNKIEVIVMSQKYEWANFEEEFKKFGAMGFLKKDNDLYTNLSNMILSDNRLDTA